jgi:hypothetical protein
MRLSILHHGHELAPRLLLRFLGLMSRCEPPDAIKLKLYRPRLFGNPHSNWIDRGLRGESDWSIGERELFATYTSHLNGCSS